VHPPTEKYAPSCTHPYLLKTKPLKSEPFLNPKTTKPLEIKEFLLYQNLSLCMVEAVGIEPTSENISTGASPSAVSILTFPQLDSY